MPKNTDNLKKGNPAHQFKKGERRASELGKKGGKQLKINNQLRKSFAAIGEAIGSQKPSAEAVKKLVKLYPDFAKDEINNKILMLARIAEKAKNGDLKAFEIFRDTIGEKPVDRLDQNVTHDIIDSIVIVDGKETITLN